MQREFLLHSRGREDAYVEVLAEHSLSDVRAELIKEELDDDQLPDVDNYIARNLPSCAMMPLLKRSLRL